MEFLGKIKFKIKYYSARILLYLFILPKKSFGAEIGVRWGGNAKLLYYLTRPKELILVDSYEEIKIHSRKAIEGMYNGMIKWIKNKSVYMLRTTSRLASRTVGKLDWVYIDSDHTDLYNDLVYWFSLADIIMGDDYGNTYPQIKTALDRFCKEKNLKYKTLHYQWWLKKS